MSWHQAQVGRLRAAGRRLGAVALLVVVVGGCDTGSDGAVVPTTSDVAAPSATSHSEVSERDAVVTAYKEFWVRLRYVEDKPEKEWQNYLGAVAVDPQLRLSLQATRFQKAQGIALYGEVAHRVTDVDIDKDTATVEDCQDASETGQTDAKTGERKTVGVLRAPTRARLKRSDAGEWKVAKVTHPDGGC